MIVIDTLITTGNFEKKSNTNIKVGDEVLAYRSVSRQLSKDKVLKVANMYVKNLAVISSKDIRYDILLPVDYSVFTQVGWVSLPELKLTDQLLSIKIIDGYNILRNRINISRISLRSVDGVIPIFCTKLSNYIENDILIKL